MFTVNVKPIIEKPGEVKKDEFGYSGDKLSLNFQNIDVRAALQVIADFTGLNFVTSDSVKGNLTLRLKDVPWDQALDIIADAKSLAIRKSGNVVRVGPTDEVAAKEKAALEAGKVDARARAADFRADPGQLRQGGRPGESAEIGEGDRTRWSGIAFHQCLQG
ncbi:MAG: secretin and TonB N-terminal domain-containing protein [Chromatiales bacterium]|nr:secretin and TonB N-terminal domain-containing protein [Chromatiales bacterium]